MSLRVRIDELWATDELAMWVIRREGNKSHVAAPISLDFKEVGGEAFRLPTPTLQMGRYNAMELIHALFDGLAASDFIDAEKKSDKHIKAMQAHLEDMRSLANRMLSILEKK